MPHRRSSDVASAVWLIDEEGICRTFISPSVMGVTNRYALALASTTAVPTRQPRIHTRRKLVTFRQDQSAVGPLSPVGVRSLEFEPRTSLWLLTLSIWWRLMQLPLQRGLPQSLKKEHLHTFKPMTLTE
ncbi:hypothetical protein B5807_09797 [Epicoccum nigrum]|uniref:Uncharacterized protein n=1 Tax=Epicoccum nigrum TaxID=105696 RepID=A0A1Y2LSZ9_EPING|nr:hypothetical protein B5807_09797 [Epicoccum nigrum]